MNPWKVVGPVFGLVVRGSGRATAACAAGALALVGAWAGGAAAVPAAGTPGSTTRVSVSSSGAESEDASYSPTVSSDGHLVAFVSVSKNLSGTGSDHHSNILVRNRRTHTTTLISVGRHGVPARNAKAPSISGSGRYVAFEAEARLVPKDHNATTDVYVRDRVKHTTRLMSVNSQGIPGADPPPGDTPQSFDPSISADGRYVAFSSQATNLVPHDTNGTYDVFVHDRVSGVTRRVSVGSNEKQASGTSLESSISAHGRYVAFASLEEGWGGGHGVVDVFVRDRRLGVTRLASATSPVAPDVGDDGDSRTPSISGNGRYVAFVGRAPDPLVVDEEIWDVYVRDMVARRTMKVSVSADGSTRTDFNAEPAISANGRYVAFDSHASDLVRGDTNGVADVFVRDLVTNRTRRASLSRSDLQVNGDSGQPAISSDGAHVAFYSWATNLVAADTNNQQDCFVRDLAR